jgi:hypothetical protein
MRVRSWFSSGHLVECILRLETAAVVLYELEVWLV